MVRSGWAAARYDLAGVERRGIVSTGEVRQEWPGFSWREVAGNGEVWQATLGLYGARLGQERSGPARRGRQGMDQRGEEPSLKARQARCGQLRSGPTARGAAWSGSAGQARSGMERCE